MKYFIDCEFIEGFHKPFFGKRRHFIDLISIGIVAEDGRKFYQVSSEYNYHDADQWVKDNVILPLYKKTVSGDNINIHTVESFHKFYGLKNSYILDGIKRFVNPLLKETPLHDKAWNEHLIKHDVVATENRPIEFYGYYCDYDWVLFCSLFGRMIDLPKGFPMYCRDVKQIVDETALKYSKASIPIQSEEECLTNIKARKDYPQEENEHNAQWTKELYDFITTKL